MGLSESYLEDRIYLLPLKVLPSNRHLTLAEVKDT
jgi:hypothetical protein